MINLVCRDFAIKIRFSNICKSKVSSFAFALSRAQKDCTSISIRFYKTFIDPQSAVFFGSDAFLVISHAVTSGVHVKVPLERRMIKTREITTV